MKETHRINFDFPYEEYGYLKMICHRKKMSLKDFLTQTIMERIEDEEDRIIALEAEKRLANAKPEDFITWNEAVKLAGWDVSDCL